MRVDDFDFELPEDRIALRPVSPRRSARMLVVQPNEITDSRVEILPDWLRPNDILVFNDTKVIPARLFGVRRRGDAESRMEATLVEKLPGQTGVTRWRALARPAKRLAPGDILEFGGGLTGRIESRNEGFIEIAFDCPETAFDAALAEAGVMPLPPYIAGKRPADARDLDDYQTIFAEKPGAVAAPTASLHFDDVLLEALRARGIRNTTVTLHVGAGTFLPVKVDDIKDHRMHAEWGEVSQKAVSDIENARAAGGRVIAVGTTALRLLETAARSGSLGEWSGETDIFITPGFRFHIVDVLLTNFHLPRSTLFMLVSAFCGIDRMKAAYRAAVESRYRFYSYGDASLLFRSGNP